LLRSSTEPQAQVAAAARFFDQSHMVRAFRAVLGRTPGEVRREWHREDLKDQSLLKTTPSAVADVRSDPMRPS
jgi:AraC-like DNA-binding protein